MMMWIKQRLLWCALVAAALSLTACGGSDGGSAAAPSDDNNTDIPGDGGDEGNTGLERPVLAPLDPDDPNPMNASCNTGVAPGEVNWAAVTTEILVNDLPAYQYNCEKLSDYNFFADPTDPTKGLHGKGTLYEMNTQLFTDYASKYRFVLMPDDVRADYMAQETFVFPVGTVLIKSFALPSDTSSRGIAFEELIETRLLIKRESGWVALAYVWNEDYSDAQLTGRAYSLARTVTHQGEERSFKYAIPSKDQCTTCHNIKQDIEDPTGKTQLAGFAPIGPKARFLNAGHAYEGGVQNQLEYWAANDLLENLPADLDQVETVPSFNGDEGLDAATVDQATLQSYAKAYLDINCAHCHRQEGKAGSTSLFFPYWLAYEGNETAHGRCKTSLTSTKAGTVIDLWPGDAENSLIHYRMSIVGGEMMPELGRDLVHNEGLALVADWINSLEYQECAQ